MISNSSSGVHLAHDFDYSCLRLCSRFMTFEIYMA